MKFAAGSLFSDANDAAETTKVSNGATRSQKGEWINDFLITLVRAVAPFTAMVATASLAHAAPTIDMSGVTSVMQTVQTACPLIGAIIVLISLVFSVFFRRRKHHARGHGCCLLFGGLGHRPRSGVDRVLYWTGRWVDGGIHHDKAKGNSVRTNVGQLGGTNIQQYAPAL